MGKHVRVEWSKQDRYGRLVGKVWVTPVSHPCASKGEPCPKTLDVNLAQLTVGLAWHYKEYEKEQSEEDRHRYAFAEQEARARKAGLWSEPDPTPPWDWRHGNRRRPDQEGHQVRHLPRTRNRELLVGQELHEVPDTRRLPRERRSPAEEVVGYVINSELAAVHPSGKRKRTFRYARVRPEAVGRLIGPLGGDVVLAMGPRNGACQ